MSINERHGMSKTRLYRLWDGMKSRCYRKSTGPYSRYGGRGITVCDEWRKSFQAFYEWSVVNGYAEDLSLDRIDPNGNYEPTNCRWVTMKEQENHKRNNVRIEFNGIVHTLTEWCELLGIARHVMEHRIKRGWSVQRAFTTEVRKYDKNN